MACRVFIGIGSNVGDRKAHILDAIERIDALRDTRVVKHSSIYESEPHGDIPGWFLNCAIEIETSLMPDKLLLRLREIERALGRKRVRTKQPGPRTIDLDILFYESQCIDTPTLRIPHPELHQRRFVLAPLSELAPQFVHPVLGTTVSHLLAGTKDAKRLRLFGG